MRPRERREILDTTDGGSESSGRPSMDLKIENFTDDYQWLQFSKNIQLSMNSGFGIA